MFFKYGGYFTGIVAIVLLGLSYFIQSILVMFLGVIILIFSIFYIITISVVLMYQKDKVIDYELIKKSNLTIVVCENCQKENVLEDQYCIHCGERLRG